MGFIQPLNDKACLELAMAEAKRLVKRPEFRRFVEQFSTLAGFKRYIRSLEQRDDLGDPDDGPRIPCEVSQRLRYNPKDPNCFERSVLFLAAAEILEPGIKRTMASLMMDSGWHTFPVEFHGGRPQVVVLDPISPPTNAMLATAYKTSRISPMSSRHLVPWFGQVARNAFLDDGCVDWYDDAIGTLRNAVLTGQPLDDYEELGYMLDRAAHDAAMWGGQGHAAIGQIERSLRNLSIKLNKGMVAGFLKKLTSTAETLAPHAIKAVLVSQLGPAAGLALQGVDIALEQESDEKAENGEKSDASKDPAVGSLKLTLESSESRKTTEKKPLKSANGDSLSPLAMLRRMTLGFRQNK